MKKTIFSFLLLLSLFVSVQAHAQAVNPVDLVPKKTLTATTGNDFSAGDLGCMTSAGTVTLANALNSSTSNCLLVMALETITGGNSGAYRLTQGEYTTSGLTPGALQYLSTTGGAFTETDPTIANTDAFQRIIGRALNSTTLIFGPVNAGVTSSGGTTGAATTTPTVEASADSFESDGTITVDTSTFDTQAGDLLFMFAATDETDATETTYTPPSGFGTLVAQQRANSGAAGTDFGSWYKVAGVGEASSYDLGESGLKNTAVVMLRVSGLDTSSPVDVSSCSTGTTEPITAPSVNVTVDDALVFTVFAWDASKTVVLAPSGFTETIHSDNSGVDLWVGSQNQASAGASGTNVMDVSSDAPWIACTIALKEPNAVSSGGGSGDTEGAGPFSVLDDGSGNSTGMKLTLPIACDGTFVGSACEIFPNNDPSWSPGDDDLATFEHPTYFIRDLNYYTFCSPNTGATTATASNGRSELRYLYNWTSGVIDRQYVFRVADEDMVNGLKANIGQIHRGGTESSPIYKGTYTHTVVRANTAQAGAASTITLDASASASDDTYNGMGITITSGTGVDQVREITDYVGATKVATVDSAWSTQPDSSSVFEIGNGVYRILTKKTDGASDFSFDPLGLGDKVVLDGLVSNSFIRIRRQYDFSAQTLKFWVSNDQDTETETVLTGTADVTLTGVVVGSGGTAYEKDGMYMNSAGDGSNTTPYCSQYYQSLWTLGQ